MRALGAEVRALEVQLANTPASAHAPIVRRLDRIFAQREQVMNEWITVKLASAAVAGMEYAGTTLGAGLEVSALMGRAIAEIQAATFAEVAGSTRYLSESARALIRVIAKDLTELTVSRGLSIPEARKLIAARMRGGGIRAFVDASGRAWRLETYSEMLIRTRTAEAYNTGTILRARELGVEILEVFDGTEDDEACAEANGQFWTAEYAMANQIEHPNCRRAFGPAPDFIGEPDAA